MTADLDLSPEAVERLAQLAEAAIGLAFLAAGEGLSISGVSPEDFMFDLLEDEDWETHDKRAAATIRALSAENARLRAERDAAWQAGAEAMREAAANEVAESGAIVDHPSVFMGGPSRNAIRIAGAFADAIRALPLPGQPAKEGS